MNYAIQQPFGKIIIYTDTILNKYNLFLSNHLLTELY